MYIEATNSVQRRWEAVLCVSVSAVLAACGGGSDDSRSGPQTEAVAQSASDARMRSAADKQGDGAAPQRRKERAYDRKGVTALIVAPSGNAVAIATGDGKLSIL